MDITLNVNIHAPELVKLMGDLLEVAKAQQTGKPVAVRSAPPAAAAETPPPAAEAAPEKAPRGRKPNAAKEAPPAAEAAPEKKLEIDDIRSLLSKYALAKKLGPKQTVDYLVDNYKVPRVSELPKERYAEFKANVEAALANSEPNPLD